LILETTIPSILVMMVLGFRVYEREGDLDPDVGNWDMAVCWK
jgi:hypothetical protein